MIGSRVSQYEILEKLGQGGMGEVYLARDTELGRRVAIKVLPARLSERRDALERFQREARAAAALEHPNIVTVYEVIHEEGLHCIVMAYVEGERLSDQIARGPLPTTRALDITLALCDALAEAHAAGIVHRDLKPDNIIIDAKGCPRVLDFGLALDHDATRVTQDGSTVGTLHYMAPEQARGEAVDQRADVFSLGAILYEMLTGQRAFPGGSTAAIYHRITEVDPAPPSRCSADVGPELDRIVLATLAKDREQRVQTASALAAALLNLGSSASDRGLTPAPRSGRSRRVTAGIVAAVVVALAAWATVTRFASGPTAGVVPGEIRALAVLPFEGTTADAEPTYFADGMTDALITELGKISALQVVARGSSMGYRDSSLPRHEIARALGADVLVEGSVMQAGEKVRINVELVRASGDRLWGESYESPLGDVFLLQADVARAIAAQVRVNLAPFEEARFRRARAVDPDALRSYLKGRYYANLETSEGLRESMEHYARAIQLDPTYADAFVAMADAHFTRGNYSKEQEPDWSRAVQYAERALQLDDAVPGAYTVLAQIRLLRDWDLGAAEDALARARELDPGSPLVHAELSTLLLVTGRASEGVSEQRSAVLLNPLDHGLSCSLTRKLYAARRYDEAIDHGHQAARDFPSCAYDPLFVAEALIAETRASEAIDLLNASLELEVTARALARLGVALSREGRPEDARATLQRLRAASDYDPYFAALLLTELGDTDAAFASLDEAFRQRSPHLVWLHAEPGFDSLREDPRFDNLRTRVGLWRS